MLPLRKRTPYCLGNLQYYATCPVYFPHGRIVSVVAPYLLLNGNRCSQRLISATIRALTIEMILAHGLRFPVRCNCQCKFRALLLCRTSSQISSFAAPLPEGAGGTGGPGSAASAAPISQSSRRLPLRGCLCRSQAGHEPMGLVGSRSGHGRSEVPAGLKVSGRYFC
jgi:hypothetical protein